MPYQLLKSVECLYLQYCFYVIIWKKNTLETNLKSIGLVRTCWVSWREGIETPYSTASSWRPLSIAYFLHCVYFSEIVIFKKNLCTHLITLSLEQSSKTVYSQKNKKQTRIQCRLIVSIQLDFIRHVPGFSICVTWHVGMPQGLILALFLRTTCAWLHGNLCWHPLHGTWYVKYGDAGSWTWTCW